jgi:hypothetical protein
MPPPPPIVSPPVSSSPLPSVPHLSRDMAHFLSLLLILRHLSRSLPRHPAIMMCPPYHYSHLFSFSCILPLAMCLAPVVSLITPLPLSSEHAKSSPPDLRSCTIMCPSLRTGLHALSIRPFSRSRWHHEKTSTSQKAELTRVVPDPKEAVIEVVGGG